MALVVSTSGSCTFPDVQHFSADYCLYLRTWRWEHSFFIAPMSTFGCAEYSVSSSYSNERRNRFKCTMYLLALTVIWSALTTKLALPPCSNSSCWFGLACASYDWDALNCSAKGTFSISCLILSPALSRLCETNKWKTG